ncbi:MAG TPA: hypothetical protein VIM29_06725, partial [Bacillota bacterium]
VTVRVFLLYLPQPAKYQEVQVTVGLLARDIPPYLAVSIRVGQDLFQDGTNAYLGKITAKATVPAEVVLPAGDKLLLCRSPRNLDLRLTLRRSGRLRSGPARALLLGKLAIRVGDRIQAHSLYTSLVGEVESLRFR